jgi:hypothetical protein
MDSNSESIVFQRALDCLMKRLVKKALLIAKVLSEFQPGSLTLERARNERLYLATMSIGQQHQPIGRLFLLSTIITNRIPIQPKSSGSGRPGRLLNSP